MVRRRRMLRVDLCRHGEEGKEMKRFLTFAGGRYELLGGMDDMHFTSNEFGEACAQLVWAGLSRGDFLLQGLTIGGAVVPDYVDDIHDAIYAPRGAGYDSLRRFFNTFFSVRNIEDVTGPCVDVGGLEPARKLFPSFWGYVWDLEEGREFDADALRRALSAK